LGSCRLVHAARFVAATDSLLFHQFSSPVRLLNRRVELATLASQLVSPPAQIADVDGWQDADLCEPYRC